MHFILIQFRNRVALVPTTQEQTQQRLPQMIVKKLNANGRIVVVNSNASNQAQLQALKQKSPNVPTNAANQRGGPRFVSLCQH